MATLDALARRLDAVEGEVARLQVENTALRGQNTALQGQNTALQDANTVLRRCLVASGAVRRETLAAQEHRLRFEKVRERHPVRGATRDQLPRPSRAKCGHESAVS